MSSPHRASRELAPADRESLDRLLPLVYEELRRMAHFELLGEHRGHTLCTTDLVHEAYVKLAEQTPMTREERPRFLAAAATAMRRVLIEHARRRNAQKREGGRERVDLDHALLVADERSEAMIALDDALTRLAALDERLARVVECRYFGGLTEDETAEALGITSRTVRRDWVKAKGWLFRALSDPTD